MGESPSTGERKTSIAPMLSVRNGAKAIEFYKAAFGASAVVARLSRGEAEFWAADESPEHLNFSPSPWAVVRCGWS